jgi:hypothetical protein
MSALVRTLTLVGLAAWLLAQACNKSESRESSAGGPIETDDRGSDAAGGGTTAGDGGGSDSSGTDAGGSDSGGSNAGGSDSGGTTAGDATDAGTTDAVGSDDGDQGATQLTGETIETCKAQDKNWIAVVDSGNSPPACGEALVSWCCSRDEIKARFPSFATQLESRFATIVDGEQHTLYHCSHNGATTAANAKTTFHFAKVVDGRTCYKTVFVSQVVPAATGAGGTCPADVTAADLNVDGPACDGSDADADTDTDTGGTALTFTNDVRPILAASCNGSGCHDVGSTGVEAALQFNTSETAFKAKEAEIKAAINGGTMPGPSSGKTLSNTNKQTIIDFLDQ